MDDQLGALTTIFTEFYYWMTVVLMFLIHVGFCMYEVGASRYKHHQHTLMKNTLLIPLVTVTWFFFGWWIYWAFPTGPGIAPSIMTESTGLILGGGFGVGISLFELSIGLWIATEIVVKFPNIYGRISSGISVLVIQQLFGSPVIESFQNFQNNWEMLLYFAPALIPNLKKPSEIKYSPWFFLGFLSFFGALLIWETGVPDHPWCNPDSWLQAHMIWHLLCSAATFSFFKLYRTEKYLN